MGSLILGPTEIYFVNLAHAMINRLWYFYFSQVVSRSDQSLLVTSGFFRDQVHDDRNSSWGFKTGLQ